MVSFFLSPFFLLLFPFCFIATKKVEKNQRRRSECYRCKCMRRIRNRKPCNTCPRARAGLHAKCGRCAIMHSAQLHGVAAVVHAGESLERAPNDFPDDLLSVATSCLDLSASLNDRAAPISARHSTVHRQREERILSRRVHTIAAAQRVVVLQRARSRGCSRRAEFSLEGIFTGGSLCTVLYPRAPIDRSRDARGDPGAT